MIRVAVVTVSDSVVAGTREDRSGPALRDRVLALGWTVTAVELAPDESEKIAAVLRRLADSGEIAVILTTGGTGVALRDVTPEATRGVIEREIPGLGELMRAEGLKFTPTAVLSRGIGWTPRPDIDCESAGIAQGRGGVFRCHRETGSAYRGSSRRKDQPRRCATLEICAMR